MSRSNVLRHINVRGTTYYLVAAPEGIAPIEDGDTSSDVYGVGDYILRNDKLYRVIKAIGIGGTFVSSSTDPNRNILATSVGAELKAIRNALDI